MGVCKWYKVSYKIDYVGDNGVARFASENIGENRFPDNPDELLPEIPRNEVTNSIGTVRQTICTSDYVRIRAEKHPLLENEVYNPRHHGVHYHVEYRIDSNKSWGNAKNVKKLYPDGYIRGEGTGFLPGEEFPGM